MCLRRRPERQAAENPSIILRRDCYNIDELEYPTVQEQRRRDIRRTALGPRNDQGNRRQRKAGGRIPGKTTSAQGTHH